MPRLRGNAWTPECAARLRKARMDAGMNGVELSARVGHSHSRVCQLENLTDGRGPSLHLLVALADALDCSVDHLLARPHAAEPHAAEGNDLIGLLHSMSSPALSLLSGHIEAVETVRRLARERAAGGPKLPQVRPPKRRYSSSASRRGGRGRA